MKYAALILCALICSCTEQTPAKVTEPEVPKAAAQAAAPKAAPVPAAVANDVYEHYVRIGLALLHKQPKQSQDIMRIYIHSGDTQKLNGRLFVSKTQYKIIENYTNKRTKEDLILSPDTPLHQEIILHNRAMSRFNINQNWFPYSDEKKTIIKKVITAYAKKPWSVLPDELAKNFYLITPSGRIITTDTPFYNWDFYE